MPLHIRKIVVGRTLTIICAIVVAESLLATILFPFVYFMVRDFRVVEEQEIGYWAGLITSAFFISQSLTAAIWGMASEKFGRKPIMVVGLLGSAACMILFGLSNSLAWAVVSRALCGIFNGNAGVTRTSIGELAHNAQLDEGKTFSLFGLCSAIGYIIGPLIGGFLTYPAKNFGFRGPADVFLAYPYLLPCLASSCYNILISIIASLLLDETNQKIVSIDVVEEYFQGEEPNEGSALLEQSAQEPYSNPGSDESTRCWSSTILCVLGMMCLSFHAILFDEIYPMFAATGNGKGLGLDSQKIAISLSIMGPMVLLAALVVFPLLSRRFSALTLWRASASIFAAVYPIFSLLPSVSLNHHGQSRVMQSIIVLSLLAIRFATNVVAYTSGGILLNQLSQPSNRSVVMGLVQTAMSIGRAFGPALGGLIWSWSLGNGLPAPLDSHVLFVCESTLAVIQLSLSLKIVVPSKELS